jgi:hypothetical protein
MMSYLKLRVKNIPVELLNIFASNGLHPQVPRITASAASIRAVVMSDK